MNTPQFKRLVVKVGSNVLTDENGQLDVDIISSIVDQVAALHNKGVEVLLISSGAVAAGRALVHTSKKMDPVDQRQLFSAVGQVQLINLYFNLFQQKGLISGQVLTTKENFKSRRHYLNQKNCMSVMLEHNVIPIINENDTISVTELMFTDNDELSGLIASMMDAEALIILSNIDGIYDGNPSLPESRIIPIIKPDTDLRSFIASGKSTFGRGGMLTKSNIARKVAEEGIPVFIANGKRINILTDLVENMESVPHTRFEAYSKTSSAVKKWIAHSEGFAKGKVFVNEGCMLALHRNKASSILPVGITKISGSFEKGDIVRIYDPEGNSIGVGKAQYGSLTATEVVGKKGERPLVHYDYLYLD